MMNAYFILLIFPCVGGEHWINVGTELFTRADFGRRYWKNADVALLNARMQFQRILPSDVNELMNADNTFVEKTVESFQATLHHVKRDTKDPEDAKILTAALSDAIGGYTKLFLLPLTKVFYYSGILPYDSATKTSDLYQEVTTNLNTSGTNWRNPNPSVLSLIITKSLRQTREKPGFRCDKIEQPCNNFQFIEKKRNGRTEIPLPVINWKDKTMFTPIRNETTFSLNSPEHAVTLKKYYKTAKCCANLMGSEYEDHFDNNFQNWILMEVVPHLNDDKMYLTLYDVLALYNYNIQEQVYNGVTPKIKVCSVSVHLHKLMNSKTLVCIILLVLIEMIFCCIVCIRLLRKKPKGTDQTTMSSNSIEQGWGGFGGDFPSESQCPSMRPHRNIIIDPGDKCNITVDIDPKKPYGGARSKSGKPLKSSLVQRPVTCPDRCTCGCKDSIIKIKFNEPQQSDQTPSQNSTSQTSECDPKECPTFKHTPVDKSKYESPSQTPEYKPKYHSSSQTPTDKPKYQSSSQTREIKPNVDNQLSQQKNSSAAILPRNKSKEQLKSSLRSSNPKLSPVASKCGCHVRRSANKVTSPDSTAIIPKRDPARTNISKICNCPPDCIDCSEFCERNLRNRIPITIVGSQIDLGPRVGNTETTSQIVTQIYEHALPLQNESTKACVKEILEGDNSLPPHYDTNTISIGNEIESIIKNNTLETESLVSETASYRTQVIKLKQIQSYLRLRMESARKEDADFKLSHPTMETFHEQSSRNQYNIDNISVLTNFVDRQSSPIHEMFKDAAVSNLIMRQIKDVCVTTSATLLPFSEIRMTPEQEPLPSPIIFHYDDESSGISQYISSHFPDTNEGESFTTTLISTERPKSIHRLNEPAAEFKGQNEQNPVIFLSKDKIDSPENDDSQYKKEKSLKLSTSLLLEIPPATFKCPTKIKVPHESTEKKLLSQIPVRAEKRSSYSVRRLYPQSLRYQQQSDPPTQTVQGTEGDTEYQLNTPDNISMTSTVVPDSTSRVLSSSYEKASMTSLVKKERKRSTLTSDNLKARATELTSIVSDCSEVSFKPLKKLTKSSVSSEKKKRSDLSHYIHFYDNSSELSIAPSVPRLVSPIKLYEHEIRTSIAKTPRPSEVIPANTSPRRESKLKPPEIVPHYAKMYSRPPEAADNEHKPRKSRLKPPVIRTRHGHNIDIELKIVPETNDSPKTILKQNTATNPEPIKMKTKNTIYPPEPESQKKKSRRKEKHPEDHIPTETLSDMPDNNTMKCPESLSSSLRERCEKPRGILKYTRRSKITEPTPGTLEERTAQHVSMEHPEEPGDVNIEPNEQPSRRRSSPMAFARRLTRSKSEKKSGSEKRTHRA